MKFVLTPSFWIFPPPRTALAYSRPPAPPNRGKEEVDIPHRVLLLFCCCLGVGIRCSIKQNVQEYGEGGT